MIQNSTNYDLEQIERQRRKRHIILNKRILFIHLPRHLPQNERDTLHQVIQQFKKNNTKTNLF